MSRKLTAEENAEEFEAFFNVISRKFPAGLYILRLQPSKHPPPLEGSFGTWVTTENLNSIYDVALAAGLSWNDCQPSGNGIAVFIVNDNVEAAVLVVMLPNGIKTRINYFLKQLLVPCP